MFDSLFRQCNKVITKLLRKNTHVPEYQPRVIEEKEQ